MDKMPFGADHDFLGGYELKRHTLTAIEKNKLLSKIREYLEPKACVDFVYVHGSFTEERPFRDVDIAIFFAEDTPKDEQSALCIKYSVDLSVLIGIEVDVHSLNLAPLGLKYHATRGQAILSRDDDRRHDFEEYLWIRYLDFEPFMKQNLRDLLAP
ncbi:MAG: nucleotidyltransferase domain-containing protein [Firmicutes bacterium]|nr:nucleotidyltransferase domain-containing protein [Bacillota bacterium]